MNITINLSTANLEIVNSNIISKLCNLISENSLHNVTLSGNLYSAKGYKWLIDTLVDRFSPNLIITVPVEGQYLIFTDSEVENILKNTIGDGEGVTLSLLKNADPNSSLGLDNNTSITDTRELCLIEGTDTTGGFLIGCSNIKTIGIPCNTAFIRFNTRSTVDNIVVKNIKNFLNAWIPYTYNFIRNQSGWDLYTTSDGNNILKVETLTIPSGVTFLDSIEYAPLYKCKSVTTLNVPNTLNTLGGCRYSYLLNLTFEPNSTLSKICANAFEQCTNLSLDVSTLPSTITTIKENAFHSCSNLTGALNLPNLTSLEQYAFYQTGITSITDLGSVTSISKYCFYNCTSLINITLSSSITLINDNCFDGCTSLEWVKILYTGDNDNPIVGAGTDCFGKTGYSDHNTNIKIFVPNSRVNDYINASLFWNKYSSLIYPLSDFSTYFPNA